MEHDLYKIFKFNIENKSANMETPLNLSWHPVFALSNQSYLPICAYTGIEHAFQLITRYLDSSFILH